jgi:mannose-6-phosphate isomerase-like protein (cupin superfamily)
MKILVSAATILGVALSAAAQSPGSPAVSAPSGAQQSAASDSAPVFPVSDLHARIARLIPEARSKGSSGATVEDYGSYKIQLSVRTASGGAEVHAHWDDVMIVERGSATLITGGTVVDGKTNAEGETHGSKIEGGQSRTIGPGDILTVRAGTPHQLILKPGVPYGAVVVKVHEP